MTSIAPAGKVEAEATSHSIQLLHKCDDSSFNSLPRHFRSGSNSDLTIKYTQPSFMCRADMRTNAKRSMHIQWY